MRGAPHNGLARDICRMRSTVSGATRFGPTFPARLFQRQNSRKPCRCQRTTVLGWTNRRTVVHRLQVSESQPHRARSAGVNRGGLVFRLRIRSWCRKAIFSKSRLRRDLAIARARPTTKRSQRNMPRKVQESALKTQHFVLGCNYCQRHPFKALKKA